MVVVPLGLRVDTLCHLHPLALRNTVQALNRASEQDPGKDVGGRFNIAAVQAVVSLWLRADRYELSSIEDAEWSLWTGVGAIRPAQTRQNSGILQEQPEVTALMWLWWPFPIRERNVFFCWWNIFDPEGRAIAKIHHDSNTSGERQWGQELYEWWIFPFKLVTL